MVGITEQGDASLDFSWTEKLEDLDFAIIISKRITNELFEKLLEHKDKIILHATVTGFGGTVIEPNAATVDQTYQQLKRLITLGFPAVQIVLRVDPIIPTANGVQTALNVLEKFKDLHIPRVRYSFLDMYPHVKERFKSAGVPLPYEEFMAPYAYCSQAVKALRKYSNIYHLESCAEYNNDRVGCISELDYKIMGVPYKVETKSQQRKSCSCVNKVELLNSRKRCPYKCLYCYWKD